ncbi:hypothetical protein PGT21_030881 [Puccinia graminis f. sp. tritici]|uniref:Uncharacterized protein n=1 Tax=Puccinia graminis f. sp. tritici TaxID=56615 RepID=A0A5B0MNL7_PUCGR|nr:hypothetical protein PGT21_030881 [Puccinia graminis f. sp. tritici]KAA1078555.1 hypothetical protein PGTUg99_012770 [Puccinia graminis f. sp. tritici]
MSHKFSNVFSWLLLLILVHKYSTMELSQAKNHPSAVSAPIPMKVDMRPFIARENLGRSESLKELPGSSDRLEDHSNSQGQKTNSVAINIEDESVPGGSKRKPMANLLGKPSSESDGVIKSANEQKSKVELMIIDNCPKWMTPRRLLFSSIFSVLFPTILTIFFKTLEITDHGKRVHL